MTFKCREQRLAYAKAYREANKEKIAAQKKAYREANKEEVSTHRKAYYYANQERMLAKRKAYVEANKEEVYAQKKAYYYANKKEILAKQRSYNEANKEAVIARNAKHRARKRKLIPIHLRDCSHEKQRILQTYKLSSIMSVATGVQHHVDHMWPLNDGGPHWSGNLQILTAYDNISKSASVCEDTKATIIKSLYTFESDRAI